MKLKGISRINKRSWSYYDGYYTGGNELKWTCKIIIIIMSKTDQPKWRYLYVWLQFWIIDLHKIDPFQFDEQNWFFSLKISHKNDYDCWTEFVKEKRSNIRRRRRTSEWNCCCMNAYKYKKYWKKKTSCKVHLK